MVQITKREYLEAIRERYDFSNRWHRSWVCRGYSI
jgi:hypothetical protein